MVVSDNAGRTQPATHPDVSGEHEQDGQHIGGDKQENAIGPSVPVVLPTLGADMTHVELISC